MAIVIAAAEVKAVTTDDEINVIKKPKIYV